MAPPGSYYTVSEPNEPGGLHKVDFNMRGPGCPPNCPHVGFTTRFADLVVKISFTDETAALQCEEEIAEKGVPPMDADKK